MSSCGFLPDELACLSKQQAAGTHPTSHVIAKRAALLTILNDSYSAEVIMMVLGAALTDAGSHWRGLLLIEYHGEGSSDPSPAELL